MAGECPVLLVISILSISSASLNAQNQDSVLFVEYFNKSISLITKDSTDRLKAKSVIFDLIDRKLVARNYEDLLRILGKPLHTYFDKKGMKYLFYPCYHTGSNVGSILRVIVLDENLEIIHNAGSYYLLETDEEFDYWHYNPPEESQEGDRNAPPRFRN